MPDLPTLLILALAAYRLWRLAAVDQITEPIRARLIFREGRGWEWFATMLGCSWCLGAYCAFAFALAWLLWPGAVVWVAVPLAVSTLVGLLGNLDSASQ